MPGTVYVSCSVLWLMGAGSFRLWLDLYYTPWSYCDTWVSPQISCRELRMSTYRRGCDRAGMPIDIESARGYGATKDHLASCYAASRGQVRAEAKPGEIRHARSADATT